MKEFVVNEYITLKFENKETNIYIKNDNVLNLLFSVQDIELDDFYQEGPENLNLELNDRSPEKRFEADCAILKAWADNNYDGRLLHANLALPVLEKLHKVGDQKAKKALKEEIIKRYLESDCEVQYNLQDEGYLEYASIEEIINSIDPWECNAFYEIRRLMEEKGMKYVRLVTFDDDDYRERALNELFFTVSKGNFVEFEFEFDGTERAIKLFNKLGKFKKLDTLNLYNISGETFNFPNFELKSMRWLRMFLNSPVNVKNIATMFPNLENLEIYNEVSITNCFKNLVSEDDLKKNNKELKAKLEHELKKHLKKLETFRIETPDYSQDFDDE